MITTTLRNESDALLKRRPPIVDDIQANEDRACIAWADAVDPADKGLRIGSSTLLAWCRDQSGELKLAKR